MSLLSKRIRGVRVLDMVALGLLISLILSVYLAKTIAGRERTEIASVERQIGAEHERIRLLQAEVSHLERPARIEELSVGYLGLGPISAKQETTPEALAEVVRKPMAKPHLIAAAQPATVEPAVAGVEPAAVATAQPNLAQVVAVQPVSVARHSVPSTSPKRPAL